MNCKGREEAQARMEMEAAAWVPAWEVLLREIERARREVGEEEREE